ncbi:MAG TPA: Zn-dependent protease [Cytophagales bacterium]|nr:Zn-dependent protease [Cytophagales bacterium]
MKEMTVRPILLAVFATRLLPQAVFAQNTPYGKEPLAHTFSIVARDPATGEMGVAVQSHWFSVGTLVSWGEAGVGVVATQSFVNPSYGSNGLELMKNGLTANQALESLLANDPGEGVRQVAMIDAQGNVAAHTGSNCISEAGHYVGENFSVQANMMTNATVWPAMAKAFEEAEGDLADRMMAALEAAQDEGGDIRGKQSAALLVVQSEATGYPWVDRKIDIRISDSPTPLAELKRQLAVAKAYEYMNTGDYYVEEGEFDKAMEAYSTAESMFPDNKEMKFWHAVTLANIGEVDEALELFTEVFADGGDNWRMLIDRLIDPGLLTVSEADLKRIQEVK